MLKKLSLLIALTLCVTTGSVYATWLYTNTIAADSVESPVSAALTEAIVTDVSSGAFGVDTSGLTMVIDPKEGTTHTTALKITGDIIITFTPDTTVTTGSVPSTVQFSIQTPFGQYEGQDLMTVDTTARNLTWEDADGDGVFTASVTAAELANCFTLTEFTLDTKAKYDAYHAELTKGEILLTVSEGAA